MKKYLIILLISFSFNLFSQEELLYDINRFTHEVEINSNQIKSIKEDLKIAKRQKQQASSAALPSIGYNATLNKNLWEGSDHSNPYVEDLLPPEYYLKAQVALSQKIFDANVVNAIKAAYVYEDYTQHNYEAQQKYIETTAKKVFYQTLLLQQVWNVSKISEENAYENYLNVKKKFDNGLISEFQLLQSEVSWKIMIPETSQSKRNYEIALLNIKSLAGIDLDKEVNLIGDFEVYPNLPEKTELEKVLENRADYNAMIKLKELKKLDFRSQIAKTLPTVTANLFCQSESFTLDDKYKFENDVPSFGIAFTVEGPIFTGGYLTAKALEARSKVEKTVIAINQKEQDIKTELDNIFLLLLEAEKRINSSKATIETAQKAFEIAEISVKNGLATQLEFKEARTTLDKSKLQYYSAVNDYLSAYFDWEYSTSF